MENTKHIATFVIYYFISAFSPLILTAETPTFFQNNPSKIAISDTTKPIQNSPLDRSTNNPEQLDFEFLNEVVVIVNKQNATLKESTVE
jgi:hypothetical protein